MVINQYCYFIAAEVSLSHKINHLIKQRNEETLFYLSS